MPAILALKICPDHGPVQWANVNLCLLLSIVTPWMATMMAVSISGTACLIFLLRLPTFYLNQAGAQTNAGAEVTLPQTFDYTQTGTGVRKTVSEWNGLGVMRADGSPLGNASLEGSIILPAGANGPVFLAYNNFRTTMVWNRSTYYAISVGHLADRFVGGDEIQHWPDTEERALSRDGVIELQSLLNTMGIDVGAPDGILGSRTRSAIRTFQEESGLPTDGYASADLLDMIRVMAISE